MPCSHPITVTRRQFRAVGGQPVIDQDLVSFHYWRGARQITGDGPRKQSGAFGDARLSSETP
jgi:hypothetical protein